MNKEDILRHHKGLALDEGGEQSSAFQAGAKVNFKAIGASGTEVNGGYFAEEYLQKLRGKQAARTFDEMRRSEPQISMILNGVMNPIKAANWDAEAADEKRVPNAQLHADFINSCLKEQIDFQTFLQEAFSSLVYGYAVLEKINSVVFNHPRFGTFNGLKALAFRSPKSIERWNLDKVTGSLVSVEQMITGDVGQSNTMPAQNLLVFSLQKEGDNYEGISILRAMFGPWFRKNLYLKIAAIGVEKYAIGTPIAKVPVGKEKTQEFANLKAILEAYTSHESAYITLPEGWELTIQQTNFDASKIKELVVFENTEMVNAIVANFLALGMNGAGGAFALGSDLSDFFLSTIQTYANFVADVLNRQLVPDLIKLNYGPQAAYPQIKCTGINDKAGKELCEIINGFASANVLKPDDKLETFVRKQYNLPAADPSTARVAAQAKPYVDFNANKNLPPTPAATDTAVMLSEGRRLLLDEKYVKQFDKAKSATQDVMQVGLRTMLDKMKADLKTAWNAATPANRIKISTQVDPTGVEAYRASVKEALAEVAFNAVQGARKEVPRGSAIKLSESLKLAAPKGGYYDALPANIRKILDVQSKLIADSQAADMNKVVSFQFNSSQASTDSIDQILTDIEEKAGAVIEGSTATGTSIDAAASNAVSTVTNQARLEFFFDDEVIDMIESFTFTNEDPISDCCRQLDGTTWAVDDPNVDRYTPPLHHNCKSRLVPNIKGDSGNPEIDKGTPALSASAVKSITLSECKAPNYSIIK